MSKVKKIIPAGLEGFVAREHQPYTDYDQSIIDWLKMNAESTDFSYCETGRFIFTSINGTFYTHFYKYLSDVYYTPEQFKEWIGMVNKQEEKKDMKFTKADLKDGMIVETRRNGRYVVVGKVLVGLQCSGSWNPLAAYKDDLLQHSNSSFDIVAVYDNNKAESLLHLSSGNFLNLLWERVEQTPEQIEAESIRREMEKLTERLKKLEGN